MAASDAPAVDARSFSGEETFAASADRTFAALTDPDVLARCIPDLVSAERVDDRTLRCSVKPGFSFIRATLKMTIVFSEVDAGRRFAALDIASKGIGASMNVRCAMTVHEQAGASRVKWEATIAQLGGLIAAVSPALIRGAADKVIRDGWAALRREVEA